MRAKSYITTVGGRVLVDCYPMKMGYIEGFLHKDNELDTWAFSEFTTGKRVTGGHSTREACVERANELVNQHTEEVYRNCLQGETVINTTYQDYVPMVGDWVRIVKPENPRNWGGSSMDEHVGKEVTIERLTHHISSDRIAINVFDYLWCYADGDFIPVTALEPVNEPVIEPVKKPEFYHYSTHPDYKVKVGDVVEITSSIDNWGDGMNRYVGQRFIVSEVQENDGAYGRKVIFENGDAGSNFAWSWFYKCGHFKVITNPNGKIKLNDSVIFSSSFIDFLHSVKEESRIARIILSVRELQYNGIGSLINNVLTTSEINYLTYRGDNGNISYLPKGKEHKVTPDGKWARDGRQDGKAGKVMRKIFTKSALKLFKETDFEIFNNKFKARFEDGLKFAIETDIADVYLNENRSEDGSLGGSCMRDVDSSYFEIYQNAPCKIVTLRDKSGMLHGRALLWDVVVDGLESKFMDRFYVSKDSYYDKFVEYAKDNKFFYKEYYKTYDNKSSWISPDGNKVDVKIKIKTPTDFDYYPYIDTFSYGDDGFLANYGDFRYTYNSTDGEREGGGVYDDIDDCYIDAEDAVSLYDGRMTHQDNAVYIESSNSRRYRDAYVPISEAYEVVGTYYHESDVRHLG